MASTLCLTNFISVTFARSGKSRVQNFLYFMESRLVIILMLLGEVFTQRRVSDLSRTMILPTED